MVLRARSIIASTTWASSRARSVRPSSTSSPHGLITHRSGLQPAQLLDRGDAGERLRLAVQAPAEHVDRHAGVAAQRLRDVEAGRDHGRAQVRGQRAGELQHRRPAAEHDHVAVAEQRRRERGDPLLRRRVLLHPLEEARLARERAHRAAVHALEQPRRLELVEVAPDRVDRHAELARQHGRHHAPVAGETARGSRPAAPAPKRGSAVSHAAETSTKPQKTAETAQS